MAGTATLDQLEGGVDFIGPIDRQINAIDGIEAEQRNVQFRGQHFSLEGGGHTDDVAELTAGQLGAQGLDHQRGGGAGAQTQHHAVLDLLHGGIRHRLFHLIL